MMQPFDPEIYDYPQGWYHVRIDNPYNRSTCVVDLAKLASTLPHGSGIEGDWNITITRNGDAVVTGEYHRMNDGGYYCGWVTFRFSIRQCKRNEYHALKGPCDGKFQVTHVRGSVYIGALRGGGNDGDSLYDTVYWPLSNGMGIRAIDSIVVESKYAAQNYRS